MRELRFVEVAAVAVEVPSYVLTEKALAYLAAADADEEPTT